MPSVHIYRGYINIYFEGYRKGAVKVVTKSISALVFK